MKIALHGRTFTEAAQPYIQALFDELHRRQLPVWLSVPFHSFLEKAGVQHHATHTYLHPNELNGVKLMVSMGGDGTLLEAVSHVGALQIPVIGVNVGRLGFLATVSPPRIPDMIAALDAGNFLIDERTLVYVESEQDLFEGIRFGLNDFAITKTDSSSMITVHAYLNDTFLNSYWADGLIVSTPTGSTGYSLSCGGPVLVPNSRSFILTPVSPHNLNVRPLVLEDSSVLRFSVKSRSGNFLASLDARSSVVEESTVFTVRKAPFVARLIKMPDDYFFDTLRSKLSWGLDMRN